VLEKEKGKKGEEGERRGKMVEGKGVHLSKSEDVVDDRHSRVVG